MNFQTLTVRQEGPVLFARISAPPMNLLGPELVRDLVDPLQQAEADDACRVLVFTSADPDYFIAHVDITRIAEYRNQVVKLTGEPSLGLLFRYLSESRLVTIAQIEGERAAPAASSSWHATCASPRASRRYSVSRNTRSACCLGRVGSSI